MARTKKTARKSTGSQIRIAPAHLDPVEEEYEEDPEEVHFFVELEDGRIMERDAEGNLVTPVASPEPAPAAEEQPAPPTAPASEAPASAVASGDPDDSGDDSEDSDEDEDDEDEDDEDDDINNDNNDNNDNNNNNADGNQGDGPHGAQATLEVISSVDERSFFPILLQDVLQELNNPVKPLYITNHFSEPGLDDYYNTQVHIRERMGTSGGYRTVSAHDSTTPHDTYAASISNAAKRALWSLCSTHREELSNTVFRYLPRRTRGTETTVVPLGGEEDDHLNLLCQLTAALNTEHEGATAELYTAREQLQDAHKRIAQLEAQLAGQAPPEVTEPLIPAVSPPRKRLRYGEPGSRTSLTR